MASDVARTVAAEGRFPMKAVADTLGVSRSNLHERLNGSAKPRRSYDKAHFEGTVAPVGPRKPR